MIQNLQTFISFSKQFHWTLQLPLEIIFKPLNFINQKLLRVHWKLSLFPLNDFFCIPYMATIFLASYLTKCIHISNDLRCQPHGLFDPFYSLRVYSESICGVFRILQNPQKNFNGYSFKNLIEPHLRNKREFCLFFEINWTWCV